MVHELPLGLRPVAVVQDIHCYAFDSVLTLLSCASRFISTTITNSIELESDVLRSIFGSVTESRYIRTIDCWYRYIKEPKTCAQLLHTFHIWMLWPSNDSELLRSWNGSKSVIFSHLNHPTMSYCQLQRQGLKSREPHQIISFNKPSFKPKHMPLAPEIVEVEHKFNITCHHACHNLYSGRGRHWDSSSLHVFNWKITVTTPTRYCTRLVYEAWW